MAVVAPDVRIFFQSDIRMLHQEVDSVDKESGLYMAQGSNLNGGIVCFPAFPPDIRE